MTSGGRAGSRAADRPARRLALAWYTLSSVASAVLTDRDRFGPTHRGIPRRGKAGYTISGPTGKVMSAQPGPLMNHSVIIAIALTP